MQKNIKIKSIILESL